MLGETLPPTQENNEKGLATAIRDLATALATNALPPTATIDEVTEKNELVYTIPGGDGITRRLTFDGTGNLVFAKPEKNSLTRYSASDDFLSALILESSNGDSIRLRLPDSSHEQTTANINQTVVPGINLDFMATDNSTASQTDSKALKLRVIECRYNGHPLKPADIPLVTPILPLQLDVMALLRGIILGDPQARPYLPTPKLENLLNNYNPYLRPDLPWWAKTTIAQAAHDQDSRQALLFVSRTLTNHSGARILAIDYQKIQIEPNRDQETAQVNVPINGKTFILDRISTRLLPDLADLQANCHKVLPILNHLLADNKFHRELLSL